MRILAALPLLAAGVCAQTEPAPALPDRPAVALSKYKDSWAPVVGFEAGAPIALDNGGKVSLPANAGLILSVGDRYADGFVTVADAHATELPETMNAVIWIKQGKYRLALSNISGSMMIQATVPTALGLFFTPWLFDGALTIAAAVTAVVVAGLLVLLRSNALTPPRLALFAVGYAAFALGVWAISP